jgi:AbrB family looped-hinge helix DNA binding protein
MIGLIMHVKNVFTTKMSSKGQIVIPEGIRDTLGLKPGTQFVVVGKGDTVILKSIDEPPMVEFEELIAEARKSAKKVGLTKAHLSKAIKDARAKK